MKLTKLLVVLSCSLIFGHAFAQEEVEQTTTTTDTAQGTTTTRTEDRDDGAGAGGFFVEPLLRYDKISGDVDYPAPFGSSSVDADGVGVGARVGFHIFDAMFIAAEGNYSQLHISEGATDYSSDGSAYSYGPTVGFQTPWAGIRVWGSYIAGGQFDPSSHNNIDLKFKDLTGYKVGVGFRVAKVGISVEYLDATYDKIDVQEAGPLGNINTDLDLKHTGWLASLSFPMAF